MLARKLHSWISCIQNNHQICSLASIENNMPGFPIFRPKIRSVFLRALKTTCLDFLYPDQKSGLFFCEHWKRHAWISCIQIKNQVCFLASIGNDMLGLFVSKTKTRCVFLRALQKMFGYLHAKTKITCIFLNQNHKYIIFFQ